MSTAQFQFRKKSEEHEDATIISETGTAGDRAKSTSTSERGGEPADADASAFAQALEMVLIVHERHVPTTSKFFDATQAPKKSEKTEKASDGSSWQKDILELFTGAGGGANLAFLALTTMVPGGPVVRALSVATAAAATALAKRVELSKEELARLEMRAMTDLMETYAMSPTTALRNGLRFAPGHPRVNTSYRPHPLAGVPGSGHEHQYIPSEGFDQLLLDEREAELLHLLAQLGATRIVIKERKSSKAERAIEGQAKGGVAKAAEVEVSAAYGSSAEDTGALTREFDLVGKKVRAGDLVDRSAFAWLGFEPSWRALLNAREIGQCRRATVELKTETIFSTESRFRIDASAAGKSGGLSGALKAAETNTGSYLFQVEFGDFVD